MSKALYADAEPLFRRALAILEESLGPDHPDVALVLNNLALLLQATNRLGEAEPLYRRALAILERAFGPEHSSTVMRLGHL
jgi:tetratricopeptide (TPR) repeat protein